MKKFLWITACLILLPQVGSARQGFAIGMGPVGNIFLIDTPPIMSPGVGGGFFFDYRFQEQLTFETSFLLTSQDGTRTSKGDSGIIFLGMPTLDLKYYLLPGDPQWDPFIGTGIGLYWLTEGRREDATGGFGLGGQLAVGFDYYLTDVISVGFTGTFRSIALITELKTPNRSTAIFPYGLMGNVAFHF